MYYNRRTAERSLDAQYSGNIQWEKKTCNTYWGLMLKPHFVVLVWRSERWGTFACRLSRAYVSCIRKLLSTECGNPKGALNDPRMAKYIDEANQKIEKACQSTNGKKSHVIFLYHCASPASTLRLPYETNCNDGTDVAGDSELDWIGQAKNESDWLSDEKQFLRSRPC